MSHYFDYLLILLLLAWGVGAVFLFVGPAKATNRYVDSLAASVTRRDDAVLFRQLYRNKQPRNLVLAWFLTALLTPTVGYIYSRQWVKMLLSIVTLEGLGVWWIVGCFTMPYEVMNYNKHLADEAYAELRLARPELFGSSGSLAQPTPSGLNPEALSAANRRGAEVSAPAAQLATGERRFCSSCGSSVSATSRFCAACGQATA